MSEPTLTEKTGVRLSIAALIGLVMGLGGAVWAVAVKASSIDHRFEGIDSRIGDLPTKGDLREYQRSTLQGVRKQMHHVIVRCPRLIQKGDSWIECKVVFTEEEDER